VHEYGDSLICLFQSPVRHPTLGAPGHSSDEATFPSSRGTSAPALDLAGADGGGRQAEPVPLTRSLIKKKKKNQKNKKIKEKKEIIEKKKKKKERVGKKSSALSPEAPLSPQSREPADDAA